MSGAGLLNRLSTKFPPEPQIHSSRNVSEREGPAHITENDNVPQKGR